MIAVEARFEQIASFEALSRAAHRAARGKHLAREALAFMAHLEIEVLALERALKADLYTPQPFRTFRIRDPKPRTISAAAFPDRVVHHALCAALEPRLEALALPFNFACRPGLGTHAAVRHAHQMCRQRRFALKLDIYHFFETLDHGVLKALLKPLTSDPDVHRLIHRFIDHGAPGSPPGKGAAIGNLTSQHFANHYLRPLDQLLARDLRPPGWCRYMDDILLFGDDKAQLWDWAAQIEAFVARRLKLALRPEVTRLLPVTQGVPFLGLRLFPGLIRLDRARRSRLARKLKGLQRALDDGLTSEEDATRAAQSVIGWASLANTHRLLQSLTNTP